MDLGTHYLDDVRATARRLKELADGAVEQLTDEQLFLDDEARSNSAAIVIRHIAGNLKSRFTDFLTTDGEKPDRDRDGEFEMPDGTSRETLLAAWNLGFARLFSTLDALAPSDLLTQVSIGGKPHTVVQALDRAVSHLAYHVGQVVHMAKRLRGSSWRTLTIPRGRSRG